MKILKDTTLKVSSESREDASTSPGRKSIPAPATQMPLVSNGLGNAGEQPAVPWEVSGSTAAGPGQRGQSAGALHQLIERAEEGTLQAEPNDLVCKTKLWEVLQEKSVCITKKGIKKFLVQGCRFGSYAPSIPLQHVLPQYGQQKPKGEQPFAWQGKILSGLRTVCGAESFGGCCRKPIPLQRAGGCVMSMVLTQILLTPHL